MNTRILIPIIAGRLVTSMGCTLLPTSSRAVGPDVVQRTGQDPTLEGPDGLSSGGTTVRLKKEMAYFATLERLPDGLGVVEQQQDDAPVFQAGMDLLNAGEVDARMATWMDWTQPTGLENHEPATFLDAIHEMPPSETGYFTMDLVTGPRCDWIAEVPTPTEKGMPTPFRVLAQSGLQMPPVRLSCHVSTHLCPHAP